MGNKGQTILVVSDDAALSAAARKEFEPVIEGLRVASVTSVAAARRILEDDAAAVILLEEAAIGPEADGPRGIVPRLDAVANSLAVYAPIVVIGTAERRVELSALLDAGAADYVSRDGGCLPSALGLVRSRLQHAQNVADSARVPLAEVGEDFGEVLRHELNNPLTGILGNAELLLAVRLRETVRRLSQEWETRQHPVH